MMTGETFECTWELVGSIPSLREPGRSVREETLRCSAAVPWYARARLVDRTRAIVNAATMGFSMRDRLELLRLSEAKDAHLAGTRITDWLLPPFFEANFWQLWQTTFAFQAGHGALEFRGYSSAPSRASTGCPGSSIRALVMCQVRRQPQIHPVHRLIALRRQPRPGAGAVGAPIAPSCDLAQGDRLGRHARDGGGCP